MKCMECNEAKAVANDPRNPPLDEDPCLCRDCVVDALDDAIGDLEQEIEDLKKEYKRWEMPPAKKP